MPALQVHNIQYDSISTISFPFRSPFSEWNHPSIAAEPIDFFLKVQTGSNNLQSLFSHCFLPLFSLYLTCYLICHCFVPYPSITPLSLSISITAADSASLKQYNTAILVVIGARYAPPHPSSSCFVSLSLLNPLSPSLYPGCVWRLAIASLQFYTTEATTPST